MRASFRQVQTLRRPLSVVPPFKIVLQIGSKTFLELNGRNSSNPRILSCNLTRKPRIRLQNTAVLLAPFHHVSVRRDVLLAESAERSLERTWPYSLHIRRGALDERDRKCALQLRNECR